MLWKEWLVVEVEVVEAREEVEEERVCGLGKEEGAREARMEERRRWLWKLEVGRAVMSWVDGGCIFGVLS